MYNNLQKEQVVNQVSVGSVEKDNSLLGQITSLSYKITKFSHITAIQALKLLCIDKMVHECHLWLGNISQAIESAYLAFPICPLSQPGKHVSRTPGH